MSGDDARRSTGATPSQVKTTSRQKRILNLGQYSRIADIGASLTLKQGPLFLLTDDSGDIPPQTMGEDDRGLGLYFHDMRHLDAVSLRVNDARFTPLLTTADRGHTGIIEMTNPALDDGHGGIIPKGTIGLRWEMTLRDTVRDTLTLHNFGADTVDLTLTVAYDAHFDDMFTVRGAAPGKRGTLHDPKVDGDALVFRYDGADDHRRTTTLSFDPAPTALDSHRATYRFRIAPGDSRTRAVTIAVADHAKRQGDLETHPLADIKETDQANEHADAGSLGGTVHVETSNALFNRVLRRSFLDLAMLAMR
ncbi:MAG: hypothetical protein M3176_18535, partial [Chloroflexota bacterium]|nr:hypothetical protein [Chloroflexota bacterium]